MYLHHQVLTPVPETPLFQSLSKHGVGPITSNREIKLARWVNKDLMEFVDQFTLNFPQLSSKLCDTGPDISLVMVFVCLLVLFLLANSNRNAAFPVVMLSCDMAELYLQHDETVS